MYLGPEFGERVQIYKKEFESGYHELDDTSARYLFDYKGQLNNSEIWNC